MVCFWESEKPPSPRCPRRENRALYGHVPDTDSDLGNVSASFLRRRRWCAGGKCRGGFANTQKSPQTAPALQSQPACARAALSVAGVPGTSSW